MFLSIVILGLLDFFYQNLLIIFGFKLITKKILIVGISKILHTYMRKTNKLEQKKKPKTKNKMEQRKYILFYMTKKDFYILF